MFPPPRYGVVNRGRSADCRLAGRTHWNHVEPTDVRQPQEPRIRRLPRFNIRACVCGVRPRQDARQALQLHLPVPAGHEEADEEVRGQRPPLSLHQPEPVPEVLHRQRDNEGIDDVDQGKDHPRSVKSPAAATPLEHKFAPSQFSD